MYKINISEKTKRIKKEQLIRAKGHTSKKNKKRLRTTGTIVTYDLAAKRIKSKVFKWTDMVDTYFYADS